MDEGSAPDMGRRHSVNRPDPDSETSSQHDVRCEKRLRDHPHRRLSRLGASLLWWGCTAAAYEDSGVGIAENERLSVVGNASVDGVVWMRWRTI